VSGQGWLQLGELALAFVLSALVGIEREVRQKSAGLRTYTLGPVEDHRELIRAAARLMTAAKLVWVLSLRMAMRLNSFSLQK